MSDVGEREERKQERGEGGESKAYPGGCARGCRCACGGC